MAPAIGKLKSPKETKSLMPQEEENRAVRGVPGEPPGRPSPVWGAREGNLKP